MSRRKQHEFSDEDSNSLKKKMIDLKLSVTALAAKIDRPRPTVSKAINHGRFPRVLKQIKEQLHVA